MNFEEKVFIAKDGREILLRNAREDDAAALIDYLKIVSKETRFLARNHDEIDRVYPLEEEQKFVRAMEKNPRALMICAFVDGELAGNVGLAGLGNNERCAHRCKVMIGLRKKYWGIGIGKMLFANILEQAKLVGYEIAELSVVVGNDRALSLYESFGFKIYGTQRRSMKYLDGTYADEYLMQKDL